jgi:lipid-binding SYLF domain-containing protein
MKSWLVRSLTVVALLGMAGVASADSAAEIDRDAAEAMKALLDSTPVAKELSGAAKAILIFPQVKKAGLGIGAQRGEGALLVGGKTAGYFRTTAASVGLQAGAQKFSYAMFLMTDSAVEYLKNSDGWELGVGPTLVVVDEGKAKTLTTTTAKDDVYVFIFGQEGLMGGLGVQGSKITKIEPDK